MRETKKAFNCKYYAKFKCKNCKKMYTPDKISKEMECINCEDETCAMDGEEIQANMLVGFIAIILLLLFNWILWILVDPLVEFMYENKFGSVVIILFCMVMLCLSRYASDEYDD